MPRPSNTEQRKRQIVEATMDLIAEHGFEAAGVSAIARRAGLNQGLVYYHFDNKLDVLLHVVEILGEQHLQHVQQQLDEANAPSPLVAVDAFVDAHLGLDAVKDSRALRCWIDISGEALRKPPVAVRFRAVLDALVAMLERVIADGVAAGQLHGEPRAAAVAILAAIEGYLVLAGSARDLIPHGTAARSVQCMARGLLQPDFDREKQ